MERDQHFGYMLAAFRLDAGLNQTELGDAAGIGRVRWCKLEALASPPRTWPKREALLRTNLQGVDLTVLPCAADYLGEQPSKAKATKAVAERQYFALHAPRRGAKERVTAEAV